MEALEVETVVYASREEVYEFLVDFPRYARYSKHLREVTQHGDGGPGTEYDLHFRWWKVAYTARSQVTDLDPPARIDWRITKDIDAEGRWLVEPAPEEPVDGPASRVRMVVEYDAESADTGGIDLPRFVSVDWLIDRVKPLIQREARRVVTRVVRDLEGESREVELTVRRR